MKSEHDKPTFPSVFQGIVLMMLSELEVLLKTYITNLISYLKIINKLIKIQVLQSKSMTNCDASYGVELSSPLAPTS